jgi:hypothetical protein
MSTLGEFIDNVTASNDPSTNPTVAINAAEDTGNSDDLLFRTAQPSLGLSIAGGTTLTNISPTTAIQDLMNGKLSLAAIVWLIAAGLVFYWLKKK